MEETSIHMTPGQTELFVINQDSLEQEFQEQLADIDNHHILFFSPLGQGRPHSLMNYLRVCAFAIMIFLKRNNRTFYNK
ncbi:hypothetical protein [Sphingobacterium sp. xlx-130]|uniref:hypothetical protein n=1 Tax=Sphingobacterium sp. xlx-130 TaxID=2654323 RepID=UPI001969DFDA|nr:hypothetical protein [Sphingobacterium sp. xlx-130]